MLGSRQKGTGKFSSVNAGISVSIRTFLVDGFSAKALFHDSDFGD